MEVTEGDRNRYGDGNGANEKEKDREADREREREGSRKEKEKKREKERETEMTEHGYRVRQRSRGHDRRHNTSGLVVHSSDATYTRSSPLRIPVRCFSVLVSLLDRLALCALPFLLLLPPLATYIADSLGSTPIYVYT